jgi:hypothetical protein
MPLDVGHARRYVRVVATGDFTSSIARGPNMSDVFDDLIDHGPARIAAVIASDERFSYFGTAAFTVALQRLDQKIVSGVPMTLKHGQRAQHRRHAAAGILRPVFEVRRQDVGVVRRWPRG